MEAHILGPLYPVCVCSRCVKVPEQLVPTYSFIFFLYFRWQIGKQIVQCLSSKVTTFLNYTYSGAKFVFGYLADGSEIFSPMNFRAGQNATNPEFPQTLAIRGVLTEINKGFVVGTPFFFGPLSIIYFVSFFVSMLFYMGTLQFIVKKMGKTTSMWLIFFINDIQVGCCMSLLGPLQLSQ